MHKSRNILLIAAALASLTGVASRSTAATPSVDAGSDQAIMSKNTGIYLMGDILDNGNVLDSSLWTELSGPINLTFFRYEPIRLISFPDTSGVYTFELRAFYGTKSYADTVVYTVTKSPPFKLLSPQNGDRVTIGKPCSIQWQMNPAYAVEFRYSLDNGKKWVLASAPINPPKSSFQWAVDQASDPGLVEGASCQLRMNKYNSTSGDNFSEITTVIITSSSTVRNHYNITKSSALRLVFNASGTLRLLGLVSGSVAKISLFTPDGTTIFEANTPDDIPSYKNFTTRAQGPLLCRIIDSHGSVSSALVMRIPGSNP